MKTRRKFILITVLALALMGLGVPAWAQMGDQEALVSVLQQGGYVVYMRHGDTTGEPLDRTRDLNNRALQRNLSEAGRAQASAIGAAIRRLEIPVGHIVASPVFRARDTAELAFGAERVVVDNWLIADDYLGGSYATHLARLGEYLATPPRSGNTWLVGHVVPIAMLTGSQVDRPNFPEGAAAIFQPVSNGYRLVGILGAGWQNME